IEPDYTGDPVITGGKYYYSFDQYLDLLRANRINLVRLFMFPIFDEPFNPFKKLADGKYDLFQADGDYEPYLYRRESFVQKARARGLVVLLSLASSQMLRRDGWHVNPFFAEKNANRIAIDDQENTQPIIADDAGEVAERALAYFCDIQESAGTPQQMAL